MKTNDVVSIYVAYINGKGGKRRPVLVLEDNETNLRFYSITSKYENKSALIQQQYFPIQYWQEIGLKKKSWIDIGTVMNIEKTNIRNYKDIGKLSIQDAVDLANFSDKFYRQKKRKPSP